MLDLLVRLKKSKIALNQALILLYVKDHPKCSQKDMTTDLSINKNVVCQLLQLLGAKRFIVIEGPYHAKDYSIAERGLKEIKKLEPPDDATRIS